MTSGPNDPNAPGSPGQYPGGDPLQGAPGPGSSQPGGPQQPPQYGAPGQDAPGYGAPGYGGPQQGAPQYGAPQYGAPQYGAPQYQPYPGGPSELAGAGRPGGLGARFGARVLDAIIVGIPLAILLVIVAVIGEATGSVGAWLFGVLGAAIALVAIMGYFTWMEANRGQTIGKQALNLRTEGPNGGNPTMEQAFRRNAFYLFGLGGSLISAVLSIGVLWVIGSIISFLAGLAGLAAIIVIAVTINSSPTKQGKHDEFAGGTRVVTTR